MRLRTNDMIRIMLTVFFSIYLASCSGGGSTVAGGGGGIVGTGKQVVVSGEVTGFGSVIVNGIEFSRSTAPGVSATPVELAFDNVFSAGETVLRPGMMVTLTGSYDSATNKGSYSRIIFSPELRGTLDSGSVNASTGTFSVLGRTAQVGASTIFDGVSDINELLTRQAQALELEVSGYLDAGGTIQASRVSLKSSGFTGGKVQLKGRISAVTADSFVLGTNSVSTSGATFVGMSAADLAIAGLVVEVRGILSGSTVGSARIERKNSTSIAPIGDLISIKGVAAGSPAAGSFVLSGPDGPLLVTISGTSFLRGSASTGSGIVVPGARLEVEGAVQADGSVAALKISVETEKTVRLEGDLTSVNAVNGSLVLNGVAVTTFAGTSYRDSRNPPVSPLAFAGLAVGDHLQVYGFQDGSGRVIASQVERFDSNSDNLLQGPVSAVNAASSQLTMLGVTVSAQPAAVLSRGTTTYAGFAAFASQVSPGTTVVKAKGVSTLVGFTAISLEIQP